MEPTISQIEKLLKENTEPSVTYAALECRLAIERICYERLRLAHDYISHDDLRKWQPSHIVKTLIQDVDKYIVEGFTMSMSREPPPEESPSPNRDGYGAMEWTHVGTQVGFSANKLGKLWNALAKLALHIEIPTSKDASVKQYGDINQIAKKVREALAEIKRISEGNIISHGMIPNGTGEEVSFECSCGSQNKRRSELLRDGQTINCINLDCDESWDFVQSDKSLHRRIFQIVCRACGTSHDIPMRKADKLRTDEKIHFNCEGCGEPICVSWLLIYNSCDQNRLRRDDAHKRQTPLEPPR